MMGKRKNIALFIGMIENEFSYSICEGAMLGAKELDANLFILPAGIIDAVYDDEGANFYRYQDNVLYSCLKSKDIDAAIIEYGTITGFLSEEKRLEFLRQFGDIPVILLYGDVEGYSSICIDNRVGLEEAIEHFIIKHKCTRIGFVSGPQSNKDAQERLQVYLNTMAKHGLSVEESWITYGNFSEYCEDLVESFILDNPDMEAIVFANDSMAMGGYKAMERLHLKPGEDILVSGFDDTPVAMMLEPNLTTVKGDTRELAFYAVMECPRVIAGEEIHKLVKSKLVVRSSCSCQGMDMLKQEVYEMSSVIELDAVRKLTDAVFEQYFSIFFESRETLRMKTIVENYFSYYFTMVNEDGRLILDKERFRKEFMIYAETYTAGYIDLSRFFAVTHTLYGYVRDRLVAEADKLVLSELMTEMEREFMISINKNKLVSDDKEKMFKISLAATTRDMLQYSGEERKKYSTIINKFQKLKFASSYICTYESGIHHVRDEEWEIPDHIYIKAYHDNTNTCLYGGKGKQLAFEDIFSPQFMPQDRRFDMIVTPLYSREKQYGLMLTESGLQDSRYASQMASQVSVTLEVMEIIDKQTQLKQELERNLEQAVANNKILDEMSRKDPLTELYNRRGFMNMVKQIVDNPFNKGKQAVAIYADMDGLKIVNDEFGHDEGDFALKAIAQILSESFRGTDVVGRMGGDEFAAFAMVCQGNYTQMLKERIRAIAAEFNEQCDKPYYVNVSIGAVEFTIEENINVERVLNLADEDLYEEKKSKVKVIYKNQ